MENPDQHVGAQGRASLAVQTGLSDHHVEAIGVNRLAQSMSDMTLQPPLSVDIFTEYARCTPKAGSY